MTRMFHYDFEWEKISIDDKIIKRRYFDEEFATELEAVTYAIIWMGENGIDAFNLMYCRVEEVFDSEMRTNVLLWIGE